jgi:Protein kinase domain
MARRRVQRDVEVTATSDDARCTTYTADHSGMTGTPDATADTSGEEAAPRPRVAPGARIGRYEVVAILGAGGMGEVYRARDPDLARDVAVKRIVHGGSIDDAKTRLRREAQAMARVDHPSVVKIFDVGVDEGQLFVAMELIDGGTLGEWRRAATRGWREVVALFAGVARGLAAAHDAGLVHRDVKPGNILVDRSGRARVSDFGLARSFGDDKDEPGSGVRSPDEMLDLDVTRTGNVVGTPAYMAPEQVAGRAVTAAADQYSFSVALWEALFGARPRPGPRPGVRGVPRRLVAIVRRGLALEPGARWPSMGALADALDALLARRRRVVWLAVAVVAAVAVTSLAVIAASRSGGGQRDDLAPRLGPGRIVDSPQAGHADPLVLLHDGRLARGTGATIELSAIGGGASTRMASPDGHEVAAIRPLHQSGHFGVVTRASDASCAYWEVAIDGARPRLLLEDRACSAAIDLSPDGRTLAIARTDTVVVQDLATGAQRWASPTTLGSREPWVDWSPSGNRVVVPEAGYAVVRDSATGAELARAPAAVFAAWLDDRSIVFSRSGGFDHTELRVLDLEPAPHDALIQGTDGMIDGLSVDDGGVLVTKSDLTSKAYVVPVTGQAVDVDALAALDTGQMRDFVVMGFTADQRVVTLSLVGEDRGLIATAPHGHGVVLTVHPGTAAAGAIAAGQAYWNVCQAGACEARAQDLVTGADRLLWRSSISEETGVATCARKAPRCLTFSSSGLRWFDATTNTVAGPIKAPKTGTAVATLSVDGDALAWAEADHVVIHPIAGGADRVVTPSPPLELEMIEEWMPDGEDLLLSAKSRPAGGLLVVLKPDGTWTPVAKSATRSLYFAHASDDGKTAAVIGRSSITSAVYYALVPDGADRR